MLKEDIHAAIDHGSETETVEYKDSFNSDAPDWLEIIKDIVALARKPTNMSSSIQPGP